MRPSICDRVLANKGTTRDVQSDQKIDLVFLKRAWPIPDAFELRLFFSHTFSFLITIPPCVLIDSTRDFKPVPVKHKATRYSIPASNTRKTQDGNLT